MARSRSSASTPPTPATAPRWHAASTSPAPASRSPRTSAANPPSQLWSSFGSQGLPVTAFYDAHRQARGLLRRHADPGRARAADPDELRRQRQRPGRRAARLPRDPAHPAGRLRAAADPPGRPLVRPRRPAPRGGLRPGPPARGHQRRGHGRRRRVRLRAAWTRRRTTSSTTRPAPARRRWRTRCTPPASSTSTRSRAATPRGSSRRTSPRHPDAAPRDPQCSHANTRADSNGARFENARLFACEHARAPSGGRRTRGRRSPEGRMSRPVRRVLCLRAVAPAQVAAIHLRRTLPHASSDLPGSSGEQPSNAPCLALLQVGFTEPHRSPGALVVSYTTVSPLLRPRTGRSVLCGTVPRVTPGGCYPPPCSAEPGRSSAPGRSPTTRPPGRLIRAAQGSRVRRPCSHPGRYARLVTGRSASPRTPPRGCRRPSGARCSATRPARAARPRTMTAHPAARLPRPGSP